MTWKRGEAVLRKRGKREECKKARTGPTRRGKMALKEEKLILKGKRDFDEGEEQLGVRGNGFSGGGG